MKRVTETHRICKNPECPHKGEPQPIERFIHHRKEHIEYRRMCKSCYAAKHREYWSKNKKTINAERIWLKDQDDPEDLYAMKVGGYVRWAVISTSRRIALGEKSPYNGLSVTGCDK